jgi:SH3 domain-containing protein
MRRPDAPLSVEIPAPSGDRPAWGKVGIVAACGFLLGIVWPRLTSTRIAPHPPGEGAGSAAPVASFSPPGAASVDTQVPPPKGPAPSASTSPGDSKIAVGRGVILNCRDQGTESTEDCGSLEFDPVAVPRIKALAQCPGAAGAVGKFSIGFDVDFRSKEVRVMSGKSTTVPKEKADALVKCADNAFDKVSLAEIPHKHRRYLIFYTATFPGGEKTLPAEPVESKPVVEGPVAGTTTSESPASGFSTVVWDVVLVRDAPKTGAVVGRIMRGSRVKVISHQGEWYRVTFGTTEGWVYRGTIGL